MWKSQFITDLGQSLPKLVGMVKMVNCILRLCLNRIAYSQLLQMYSAKACMHVCGECVHLLQHTTSFDAAGVYIFEVKMCVVEIWT